MCCQPLLLGCQACVACKFSDRFAQDVRCATAFARSGNQESGERTNSGCEDGKGNKPISLQALLRLHPTNKLPLNEALAIRLDPFKQSVDAVWTAPTNRNVATFFGPMRPGGISSEQAGISPTYSHRPTTPHRALVWEAMAKQLHGTCNRTCHGVYRSTQSIGKPFRRQRYALS